MVRVGPPLTVASRTTAARLGVTPRILELGNLPLETLVELDMENRAVFLASGGDKFTCVPCLNDSEPGMRLIEHVVRRELMGWL